MAVAVALAAGSFALSAPVGATTLPPPPVAPPATTVAAPSIEQVAGRLLAKGARAVSVIVWKDGELRGGGAWGTASPDHRFQLASLSKLVTAVAVHRLVAQGVLAYDEPVRPLLARIGVASHARWGGVTLRMLLSHTSGTATNDPVFFGRLAAPSCKAVAQRVTRTGPSYTPGTRYRYSNVNYCLVGLVVEAATGRPHDAVVQDLVWGPAGVQGAHLARTGEVLAFDVAHPVTPGRRYLEPLGAAGQWMASPAEVVRVLASLTPVERYVLQAGPPPTKGDYGLGTRKLQDGAWGHTGTLEASRTTAWVEPDGTIWMAAVAGKTPGSGAALHDLFAPAVRALVAGL